jgi:cyanate permease
MLAGVWGLYFSFGLTVAAMAPLVQRIVVDLQITLSQMGTILGAWPLVYIFTAVPAGALIDRFGVRACLATASVLMAVSGLARAAAVDSVTMFLAVALFGLGGPLVSIGAPKVISEWFDDDERGTAMGIYITGPALGSIAALALTNAVMLPLLGGEWRRVLIGYAGFALLAGVVWLAIAARSGREPASPELGAPAERAGAVFLRLVRLRPVQLVLAMSVGIFFFNHGLNNWLPEILRASGRSAVEAGYWASVPTAVGVAGSLLIPRLAKPERRHAILLALFVAAGGATLLLHSSSVPWLGLGLILQGIARSSMMTLAILLLMDAPGVGSRHAGAAGGLFFSAAEVGGVLGPVTVGVVADLTGGFSAALWLMSAICAVLLVLGLVLRR